MLGEDWERDADGKKLKEEGAIFAAKLSTSAVFKRWSEDVSNLPKFDPTVPIFHIDEEGERKVGAGYL